MSGGADSLALLLLTAAWCKKRRLPPPHALTVDHGLRPDSPKEAARVAAWARLHGVPHTTLVWAGHKPAQNIQALARDARYGLIAAWMRAHDVKVLLTGHTLDDQAETFLLRLARGSGLDGLSGMAPLARFPLTASDGLQIARPLLAFAHDRLTATLERQNQPWISDPSNENDRFARVQMRNALHELKDAGLTPERIAAAAAHLRRAREAIDTSVAALVADAVEIAPWGYALVATERFAAAPREVALRALSRLIEALGGADYPPRFEQSEAVLDWLTAPHAQPKGRTLGGCRLVRRDTKTVLVTREEAALVKEEPRLSLTSGESTTWDRRFAVALAPDNSDTVFEVRRVGTAGLKALGAKAILPPVEPYRIAAALPGLWQAGRLVAAPLLGLASSEIPFSAHFSALSRLTGG